MGAPLFEQSKEMNELVCKLTSERPDLFKNIDPNMIECVLRIDKPAPKNQKKVLQIKGVRGPIAALTSKRYIVYGYASMWERLNPEKKALYLSNMLIRIKTPTQEELLKLAEAGEDYEYGKTKTPDLTDFKSFVKNVGVEWEDENSEVPDILTEKAVTFE